MGKPGLKRRTPRVLIAAGLLLLAAVGAWQLYATLWTAQARHGGQSLIHGFLKSHALQAPVRRSEAAGSGQPGTAATLAACRDGSAGKARGRHSSAGSGQTPVHGLLEIPKLDVVAPVEQGMGDAQLAVAVGHNPYSVWPGQPGNALVYAHDVSYFTALADLVAGDTVRYLTPCTTYLFKVTSHAIVTQGSPVYNTSNPTLTMITCWPTDALWFTPDRYLVTATEVSHGPTGSGASSYQTASSPPAVPAPASLVSQGVTLGTYYLPMGTFTLTGAPSRVWAQSTDPLLVEGSAVEAFIAGVRSLTESHLDWWEQLAPGVPAPPSLVAADNPTYASPLDVTEQVSGTTVTSVTLTNSLSESAGSAPGRYSLTVTESVKDGTLTISSWSMVPA